MKRLQYVFRIVVRKIPCGCVCDARRDTRRAWTEAMGDGDADGASPAYLYITTPTRSRHFNTLSECAHLAFSFLNHSSTGIPVGNNNGPKYYSISCFVYSHRRYGSQTKGKCLFSLKFNSKPAEIIYCIHFIVFSN